MKEKCSQVENLKPSVNGVQGTTKKRPGPKPKLISLHPFTFDEVLGAVLTTKPKKAKKGQEKTSPQRTSKSRKKKAA